MRDYNGGLIHAGVAYYWTNSWTAIRIKPVTLISIKEAIRYLSLVIEIHASPDIRFAVIKADFGALGPLNGSAASLEFDCILSYSNIWIYTNVLYPSEAQK